MVLTQTRERLALGFGCGLGALTLVVMIAWAPVLGLACVGASVPLGYAARRLRPGRPLAFYLAFGLSVAYAFWRTVLALQTGDTLVLVPTLLLLVGAAWVVQEPGWSSSSFLGLAGFAVLALGILRVLGLHDLEAVAPAAVRRVAWASITLIPAEVLLLLAGVGEMLRLNPRSARRVSPRGVRTVVYREGESVTS
jgi:hypothetical protein